MVIVARRVDDRVHFIGLLGRIWGYATKNDGKLRRFPAIGVD